MSKATTTHYGVSISVTISGVNHCCGAHFMHDFRVSGGGTSKLTLGQKHNMYKDLMTKVVAECSGTLVAVDCVLNFGEWEDLGRGSSVWSQSASAGDISMENFCEYFDFERTAVSKNSNSGNLVGCFSLAINIPDPDNDDDVTKFTVDEPDFSDEPKKEAAPTADIESILAELDNFI
jgi:hypothetical protein